MSLLFLLGLIFLFPQLVARDKEQGKKEETGSSKCANGSASNCSGAHATHLQPATQSEYCAANKRTAAYTLCKRSLLWFVDRTPGIFLNLLQCLSGQLLDSESARRLHKWHGATKVYDTI